MMIFPGNWARRACAAVCLAALLGGCVGGGDGIDDEDTVGPASVQRLVERDVEAPEIFEATDRGAWDGRPSLGGVWVAHPDTSDPERVIIRNEDNGQFVIGALFRRERNATGPTVQVSSDAAEALGMLAGAPATLNITALRREEPAVPPENAEPETLPEVEPVSTVPLDPAPAEIAAAPVPAASAPTTLTRPYIQIGIFSQESNAQNTATALRGVGLSPNINRQETAGKVFYRVTVGPAATEAERADLLTKVQGLGFADAYFVTG